MSTPWWPICGRCRRGIRPEVPPGSPAASGLCRLDDETAAAIVALNPRALREDAACGREAIAGLLLGLYGRQHMSLDAASTHQVFLYTYLSMAAIIALPALIFSRVPDDVGSNTVLRRRNRSGS